MPLPSKSRSVEAPSGGLANSQRTRADRVPVVVSAATRQALSKVPDCNECKFCKDKPKNGGANTMRQRCVVKQELLRQLMAEEGSTEGAMAPVPDSQQSSLEAQGPGAPGACGDVPMGDAQQALEGRTAAEGSVPDTFRPRIHCRGASSERKH